MSNKNNLRQFSCGALSYHTATDTNTLFPYVGTFAEKATIDYR
jgi:hypothetical protein